jgi:hypothetical protein
VEEEVVHGSLFTARWKIVVGRSTVRGKILISACLRYDVACGLDLAHSS